jgi:phage baseplate assembly protein W
VTGPAGEQMITLPSPGALPPRTDVAFPFRIDGRGRTASTDYDSHVRDMIELLLFTSPGERVMRPDFGCGLLDLAFEPNSPELAASLQISIQAALQRWLGDVITIASLEAVSEDAVLQVTLGYVVRATGTQTTQVFTGGSAG